MKKGAVWVAVVVATLFATGGEAATVAEGATAVGDTGGIVLTSSGSSVDAFLDGTYSDEVTDPPADWVWGPTDDPSGTDEMASFRFLFDLTGIDPATAAISGRWGADDLATAVLNGVEIGSYGGFNLADLSYSGSAFQSGENILDFNVLDTGGPAGFIASVRVTADTTPVPLPAGIVLLASGLAAAGVLRLGRRTA